MKPLVAIVGRPNVGKSTLFNRLVRRKLAIVEDIPGVTRDRHYADAEWGDREMTFIDTGGFLLKESDKLLTEVRAQAQLAVEESDVVLFTVDARAGLTAADQDVARYLRKSGKPLVLVVNKVDAGKLENELLAEFHRLGFKHIFAVSAEHNLGIETMLGTVLDLLPPAPPPAPEETEEEALAREANAPIRLAIVGRPNVGKSTLVNALLGKKRVIASEVAGTTRDPIDSEVLYKEKKFILTDTAGIRRRKAILEKFEQYAVLSSLRAAEDSDCAVLLMDATEPGVDQDAKLAGVVAEKGRPLIIVVNKWDLVDGTEKEKKIREDLKYELKFVEYAPIIFTSALTGAKVQKVLELAQQLVAMSRQRTTTPQLNRLLDDVIAHHPLPFSRGRPLRIYYIAQVTTQPPTFALTCNRPTDIPERYQRYITNQLRKTFDLRVPIRLLFRERPGKEKRAARMNPQKLKRSQRRKQKQSRER
ncbi:MAG: ribosome biogenesis GTPase Der [Myxococcaceae bacterium]